MNSVSSSMQRSIDRLVRSTMSKDGKDPGKDIIDKDGKIRFDKYQYDCDTYKTIVDAVVGFDWRTFESNKKVKVEMS